MSLGHFIFAGIPKLRIVLATQTPARSVIRGACKGCIFGLRMMENHIPPSGDIHLRPSRPRPAVWASAITSVPSSTDAAISWATIFVLSVSLKYFISFPMTFVLSPALISPGVSVSRVSISEYPRFVEESIIYPSFLNTLICFQIAVLETQSSLASCSPETRMPLLLISLSSILSLMFIYFPILLHSGYMYQPRLLLLPPSYHQIQERMQVWHPFLFQLL